MIYQSIRLLCIIALSILILPVTGLPRANFRNGKIAFTSDRDGNLEIYVMNSDGTGQVRLTNNDILDAHPAWSPDGRRIAFISQRASGAYAIFAMNADGSEKVEITPVNYQPPSFPYSWGWTISWSPDGSQLCFRDGGNVYVVNADSSGRRFLTVGVGPAWSPNGSKILFIDNSFFGGHLRTISPDGSDPQTLPPLPDFYNWYYDATWSPTGDEIATTVFDGANEVVFITDADGGNPRESISFCAAPIIGCSRLANVDWSPIGKTIVFFVLSTGEIHAQEINGGAPRQLTDSVGSNSHPSWQALPAAAFDFDADGRSDLSVFRPSDSVWYIDRSTAGFAATQFGLSTDKPTPADYDGDGKTDIGVFRDGTWWIFKSSDGTVLTSLFGQVGDLPIPSDYTGDGRDEIAVYRRGEWWTLDISSGLPSLVQFGLETDRPVPADYDGDGRTDQAVYRDGTWYLYRSSLGPAVIPFGLASDSPVVGDYDGDGKDDLAVYRDGDWYLLQSTDGFTAFQFGLATDIPVPADYDGDGKTDAAVFRSGVWYLRQTTGGISIRQFGLTNDKPVPSAYLP
jgi:dipeptidyl aminopeptidase/acylaminoacyl peptidase